MGSQAFVQGVQNQLGTRAHARRVDDEADVTWLRESPGTYNAHFAPKSSGLKPF